MSGSRTAGDRSKRSASKAGSKASPTPGRASGGSSPGKRCASCGAPVKVDLSGIYHRADICHACAMHAIETEQTQLAVRKGVLAGRHAEITARALTAGALEPVITMYDEGDVVSPIPAPDPHRGVVVDQTS